MNVTILNFEKILCRFLGPDGKPVSILIDKLECGIYRVKYKPTVVGTHTVIVTQRKQPITKQPWNVQVFDPSRVKLIDISELIYNKTASFKGTFYCINNAPIKFCYNRIKMSSL